MKTIRIITALLVLLLSSIVLVQYVNSRVENRTYPARDYILHRVETKYSVNSSPESFAYITSWVKASGDTKTLFIRRKSDGTPVVDYILANEDGQFEYESGASLFASYIAIKTLIETSDGLHSTTSPAHSIRGLKRFWVLMPMY